MKMSSVFELPVSPDPDAVWYGHKGANTTRAEFERATAHAINCHDDLVAALDRLETAARHRDNVMGDPCGLLAAKAELAAAADAARAVLAKARGE